MARLLIFMFVFLYSSLSFSLNLPGMNKAMRKMENEKYYKKFFKGERLNIFIVNPLFRNGDWYLYRNRKTCDYCDYAFPESGGIKASVWIRKKGSRFLMDGPQVFEVKKGQRYKLILVQDKWGRDNVEKDGVSIFIEDLAMWYQFALKGKGVIRKVKHNRNNLLKVIP